MGAPRGIVEPIPVPTSVRRVDEGRGDRETPIVIEPPVRESARKPFAQAVPAERNLLRRGL